MAASVLSASLTYAPDRPRASGPPVTPGSEKFGTAAASLRFAEAPTSKQLLTSGGSAEHEVHVNGVVREVHAAVIGALDQTRIQ